MKNPWNKPQLSKRHNGVLILQFSTSIQTNKKPTSSLKDYPKTIALGVVFLSNICGQLSWCNLNETKSLTNYVGAIESQATDWARKVFLKLLQKRLKKLQLPQPNTLATTKLLGLSIINLNFQINFLWFYLAREWPSLELCCCLFWYKFHPLVGKNCKIFLKYFKISWIARVFWFLFLEQNI